MDSHTLPRTELIRSCSHPVAVKHRGDSNHEGWVASGEIQFQKSAFKPAHHPSILTPVKSACS